jgi:hypothetical protein
MAQGASATDALTGGFAWLFLGAAALCLIGAGVTAAARRR